MERRRRSLSLYSLNILSIVVLEKGRETTANEKSKIILLKSSAFCFDARTHLLINFPNCRGDLRPTMGISQNPPMAPCSAILETLSLSKSESLATSLSIGNMDQASWSDFPASRFNSRLRSHYPKHRSMGPISLWSDGCPAEVISEYDAIDCLEPSHQPLTNYIYLDHW